MENKSLGLWAAVLLLVGGLVHLIPGLYTGLTNLTGGFPWIQVVVGILSVVVSLVMFAGDRQAGETDHAHHHGPSSTDGNKSEGGDTPTA